MSRPTLEVADIVRAAGRQLLGALRITSCMAASQGARCHRRAAARRRWAVIVISVSAAAIRPSRTTHAATGTAPSARATPATGGSPSAERTVARPLLSHRLHAAARTLRSRCRTSELLYDLLFRASAATLLELAADPKHLGADIGFLGVLHTWGQNLQHHPHIHCVVPAGGLAPDGSDGSAPRYDSSCPSTYSAASSAASSSAGLKQLFRQHKLQFHGSLQSLAEPRRFHAFPATALPRRLGRLRQATLRRS